MVQFYEVQKGDTAWAFVKSRLAEQNRDTSNSSILKELNVVAQEYGCDSVDTFAKKYFSKIGTKIELKDSVETKQKTLEDTIIAKKISEHENMNYSIMDKTLDTIDKLKNQSDIIINTRFSQADTNTDTVTLTMSSDWMDKKSKQDKINSLPTNKERVIEYHRTMSHSRDNYVVVDKKNYTATVYSWDGCVVKEYEVGVGKEASDNLCVRSKKNPQNNFASTTAGIYTANYRANGHDAYKRLYNDRVLTLSHDGLRARGVKVKDKDGNVTISYSGETGVAFHQVPNGNYRRIQMLDEPGATKENNRFSSGCVNFRPEDFDDCMENINGVGTKIYILPEDDNNYMCVKNGNLHMFSKEYKEKVATTSTKNDEVKNIKIFCNDINVRQEGKDMAAALSREKQALIEDLGIDNDTYNELAMLTLGLAGQETDFGSPIAGLKKGHPYYMKENTPWIVDLVKNCCVKIKHPFSKTKTSFNSRGLTQMKISSYTDENVKELLAKHDITPENLREPEKAAIATMIVLTYTYKNELPSKSIKSKIKELNLTNQEALMYLWHKRSEITQMTATPDTSEYVNNVKDYMSKFQIHQYV